jgi:plasmid stabilization system protein ParE
MTAVAHTIITRPRARADVRDRLAWLTTNRNAGIAGRWLARYDTTITALADDPARYPEADETAELGFDLRQTVFRFGRTAYRILFAITGDTVNVIRVRHSAQDRLTNADV